VLPLLAVTGRAGVPFTVLVALLAIGAAQFFQPAAAAAVPVVAGAARAGQANSLRSDHETLLMQISTRPFRSGACSALLSRLAAVTIAS
jgi:hypothetical protein